MNREKYYGYYLGSGLNAPIVAPSYGFIFHASRGPMTKAATMVSEKTKRVQEPPKMLGVGT